MQLHKKYKGHGRQHNQEVLLMTDLELPGSCSPREVSEKPSRNACGVLRHFASGRSPLQIGAPFAMANNLLVPSKGSFRLPSLEVILVPNSLHCLSRFLLSLIPVNRLITPVI